MNRQKLESDVGIYHHLILPLPLLGHVESLFEVCFLKLVYLLLFSFSLATLLSSHSSLYLYNYAPPRETDHLRQPGIHRGAQGCDDVEDGEGTHGGTVVIVNISTVASISLQSQFFHYSRISGLRNGGYLGSGDVRKEPHPSAKRRGSCSQEGQKSIIRRRI